MCWFDDRMIGVVAILYVQCLPHDPMGNHFSTALRGGGGGERKRGVLFNQKGMRI